MTNKSWKTKQTEELFDAILRIKTRAEAERFFRDLLTLKELDEISRRWQAVALLDQGLPYREIAKRTGHSTTTVARIAHWLHSGEGGYGLVLARVKQVEKL